MINTKEEIPNIENLKYHGSRETPDIKIFVSNRIDQDSIIIDNPLYIPVRCGAVYDTRRNITMLGDDTGENISTKKPYLSEFTVQYWAWKNVKADYYGLCHYRRYLSFSKNEFKTDAYYNIVENCLSNSNVTKYGMTEEEMRKKICQNDFLCSRPVDVRKLPGKFKNIKDQYYNCVPYLQKKDIEILENIIEKHFPKFNSAAKKYLYGFEGFFCNLFIMRKELFFEYNDFLFNVFEFLFKEIDMNNYSQEGKRTIGHLGERLFGIYITYLLDNKKLKYDFLQPLIFLNTEKIKYPNPFFRCNNIAITLASSNEYVPYLSVAIASIKENSNENFNYDIVVLSNKISLENKILLKDTFSKSNFSIRFVEISSYLDQQDLFIWGHITKMTYTRLACLDLFKNYKKVLYLDSDIVVNKDISDLYNTDIQNYYIAAAKDSIMAGWINGLNKVESEYVKKLNLGEEKNYFNAGVLLVNIEKFSSQVTSKELFELANSQKFRWGDQDVLNKVCEGNVYFLENSWNFMAHFYNDEREIPEYYASEDFFSKYKEADKAPNIVHYAGNVLPTVVPQVHHFFDFWKYARKSPFYEFLLTVHSHCLATEFHISQMRNDKKLKRFERILGISAVRKIKNILKKI